MPGALHLEDFTEQGYRRILRTARARYRFEDYGTESDAPHVIWRHDVDASPHRAARLAEIEADEGVRTLYCFLLHSSFYNLLEAPVAAKVREALSHGHGLGLHFDSAFYGGDLSDDELAERLTFEADILERLFERPVEAFSFHNPDVGRDLDHDADRIAGLANAYGRSLRKRYGYVSDSNGYWRFQRLLDVLHGAHTRLHVLTHPEWWTPEPALPRERLVRCVEGRAERTLADYDALLARAGRRNIG